MITDKRTEKRKLGDIGENVACIFLEKRGFEIVERNYLRKWGEIDIVAKRAGILHFVEVKSVSCVTLLNVTHGTLRPTHGKQAQDKRDGKYRPEDNMHPWKLRRLSKAIQTYLLEKKFDSDWQLDLITVRIDQKNRIAKTKIIENIII